MKRKIVKLGPATLVVSLPSKWTKKFGVQAGDELELEEQDKQLILKTEKGFEQQSEELDLRPYNHLLKRILAAQYLKGVDEIVVLTNSLKKSRIIQGRVDEFIGMEIVEQGKERLVLKDISTGSEENLDIILKRVVFLMNTLAEESIEAISNKETDLGYIEDIETNLNKFTDYCMRILNRKGHKDFRKRATLYCLVYLIEELGDAYKHLIKFITQEKIVLNKKFVTLFKTIHLLHKEVKELFFSYSHEKAISIAQHHDKIQKAIQDMYKIEKNVSLVRVLGFFEEITSTDVKIMGQLLNL